MLAQFIALVYIIDEFVALPFETFKLFSQAASFTGIGLLCFVELLFTYQYLPSMVCSALDWPTRASSF